MVFNIKPGSAACALDSCDYWLNQRIERFKQSSNQPSLDIAPELNLQVLLESFHVLSQPYDTPSGNLDDRTPEEQAEEIHRSVTIEDRLALMNQKSSMALQFQEPKPLELSDELGWLFINVVEFHLSDDNPDDEGEVPENTWDRLLLDEVRRVKAEH